MTTIRKLYCDQPACGRVMESVPSMTSFRFQEFAKQCGWSVGSGTRRGTDYCDVHASSAARYREGIDEYAKRVHGDA